jgi:hypothetical protein
MTIKLMMQQQMIQASVVGVLDTCCVIREHIRSRRQKENMREGSCLLRGGNERGVLQVDE